MNFHERQMEFLDNKNEIQSTSVDDILMWIINNHLEKTHDEWTPESLINFINSRWDKDNVIKYITYTLNNNPNNLSNDDLFQLANLKTALVKNELNSINNSIEKNRNIDFEIVWWTITEKYTGLPRHEWGLKFSKGKTKYIEFDIVNEKITDLWNGKYEILLKKEKSSRTYKFLIKYNWWNSMTIYDNFWRYISRQVIETKQKTIIQWNRYRKEVFNTPWRLTIDTEDMNIKLNIMFNN